MLLFSSSFSQEENVVLILSCSAIPVMRLSLYLLPLCFSLSGAAETPSSLPEPKTETAPQKEEAPAESQYKIPDGKTVPKMEKVSETEFKIGQVSFNPKDKSFSVPAQVNMQEGLIEYALCMPHGKTHEALFLTPADPFHMSVVTKLLGFKPFKGLFPERDENLEWKPYVKPERKQLLDNLVQIDVSWKKDGKTVTMPLSDLLTFKNTKQTLASHEWVLTDSLIYNKTYQASVIGDVIAIFGDPNSFIAYSGFANDGENVWMANPKVVPAPGTIVTITVRKLPRTEADKPVSIRPKDLSVPEPDNYM